MNDTINHYGYRHLVSRHDPDAARARGRLTELGEKRQRREKGTQRPFIPVSIQDFANHWNHLIDFTQGKHPEMSAEAARCCQQELARVFRFSAHAEMHEKRVGRRVHKYRRVAITDLQLPQCECDDGHAEHDLCADEAIDAVRALMAEVVNADTAEEAHNAVWAVDALCCALSNHGVRPNWQNLWREVCPPLERVIPKDRWPAYRAWDGKWRIVAEDTVTGDLTIRRDQLDRFQRAKNLLSEETARRQPRPLDPPADWQPHLEPATPEE